MRNKRAKRFLFAAGLCPNPKRHPDPDLDPDPDPDPDQQAILMQITARAHKNKIITIQYFLMTAANTTLLASPGYGLPRPCLNALVALRFQDLDKGALQKDSS